MSGDHILWLLIGVAIGWLGIPLVLGMLSNRKSS